jgi:probable rRNA maturation factor
MKVNIVNTATKQTTPKITAKTLQRLVLQINASLAQMPTRKKKLLTEKAELTLVFLSAQEMKKINYQFRKKNKPTDILSFESSDPNSLGELLLCMDVLKKQAKENNHSLQSEITYMIIHGILHLLGYDHEESKAEEKKMFRLQDKCFAEVVG